jgi:hypothetical protein
VSARAAGLRSLGSATRQPPGKATVTDEELLDSLLDRWQQQRQEGRELPVAELARFCPRLAAELGRRIEVMQQMEHLVYKTSCGANIDRQGRAQDDETS